MRKLLAIFADTTAATVGAGCSPQIAYRRPSTAKPAPEPTIGANQDFDDTWSAAGGSADDIALLDRDSGFIRMEFFGSPEAYADCGKIEGTPSLRDGQDHYSGRYTTWSEANGGLKEWLLRGICG